MCLPKTMERRRIYDKYPCLKTYPFPLVTAEGFLIFEYQSEDKSRILITGTTCKNGTYQGGTFLIDNDKLIYANSTHSTFPHWTNYFSYKNIFFETNGYYVRNEESFWECNNIIGIYKSSLRLGMTRMNISFKIMWLKSRLIKLLV